VCVVRDCLFLNSGHVALEVYSSCKSLSIENSLILGNIFARIRLEQPLTEEAQLNLAHNTIVGPSLVLLENCFSPGKWKTGEFKAIPVRAESNLIDAAQVLSLEQSAEHWNELAPSEDRAFLARILSWQDRNNVYATNRNRVFWVTTAPEGRLPPPR